MDDEVPQGDKLKVGAGIIEGTTADIIKFPENRIKRRKVGIQGAFALPEDVEDIRKSQIRVAMTHIDMMMSSIIPFTINQMRLAGFLNHDGDNSELAKVLAFYAESLKSVLMWGHGLPHIFQALAINIFEENDDNNMELNKKIGVRLIDLESVSSDEEVYHETDEIDESEGPEVA